MIWVLMKEWNGGNKFVVAISHKIESLRGMAKDDFFKSTGEIMKWAEKSHVYSDTYFSYTLQQVELV